MNSIAHPQTESRIKLQLHGYGLEYLGVAAEAVPKVFFSVGFFHAAL
jgi:hypothetical protein